MKKILEKIQNGKKITKATFKSFLKRNSDRLYIKVLSKFDGMTDCVERMKDTYSKLDTSNMYLKDYYPAEEGRTFEQRNSNLGLKGVWLVGDSRDYFSFENDGDFIGIKCVNCCGSFTIGINSFNYKINDLMK